MRARLTLTVATVAGLCVSCESGTAIVLDVSVPVHTSRAFSEATRGVLVASTPMGVSGFVVLCGQALPEPLTLSEDLGFGCLGDLDGRTESVGAWVQPMPSGWAEVSCSDAREFYRPLGLDAPDGGATVAASPEASWAQASASARWRRDLSPCGGILKGALTLAAP